MKKIFAAKRTFRVELRWLSILLITVCVLFTSCEKIWNGIANRINPAWGNSQQGSTTGPEGYDTVDIDINYSGNDYTFCGWQEKRYTMKYMEKGDPWIHSQYRFWQYGESGWSKWDKLGDPVPAPSDYNSYSLQEDLESQPDYNLDSSGMLVKDTNTNNIRETWWEGEYLHIMTYVYQPYQ